MLLFGPPPDSRPLSRRGWDCIPFVGPRLACLEEPPTGAVRRFQTVLPCPPCLARERWECLGGCGALGGATPGHRTPGGAIGLDRPAGSRWHVRCRPGGMGQRIQTHLTGPPWHDVPPPPGSTTPRRANARAVRRSALVCAALVAAVAAGSRIPHWVRSHVDGASNPQANAVVSPLDVLLRSVGAAADSGATDEVAARCEAIVTEYPDHPVAEPALLRLLQARIRMADERGAQAAFQMLRARFPNSRLLPEALVDVASWRYEQRDYHGAANAYTDLVALVTSADGSTVGEDTAPEPVIWRSKSLWNEHKRAERSRTELERLARFNQALSYENAGDRDSALRAYERFLSRFPQDACVPESRFRMAGLLLEEGRSDEALAAYREVYEDPLAAVAFRCESLYRAGRQYEAARRFDDAIATLRLVLPLQPADNEFRLASLGELAPLLESRDRPHALTIYRELSLSNASPSVRAVAAQRLAALEGPAAVATAPH